jgi:hypothetical protein
VNEAEIYPDIAAEEGECPLVNVTDILPEDTLLWLDSSDMYKEREFFPDLEN